MEECAAEKKEADSLCAPRRNNLRMKMKVDVAMVTTMAAATKETLNTYYVLGGAL